jgi:hypothetical protein
MLGHVEVQDAATIVREDEETIQNPEGDRRDGEEITGNGHG